MKLFIDSNHLSPYAMSAFVALREKAIPFELALVDLQRGEHLAAGYAGVSSTLRVPTLSHDGFNLSESSAICEYLEEAFPAPPSTRPTFRIGPGRARSRPGCAAT